MMDNVQLDETSQEFEGSFESPNSQDAAAPAEGLIREGVAASELHPPQLAGSRNADDDVDSVNSADPYPLDGPDSSSECPSTFAVDDSGESAQLAADPPADSRVHVDGFKYNYHEGSEAVVDPVAAYTASGFLEWELVDLVSSEADAAVGPGDGSSSPSPSPSRVSWSRRLGGSMRRLVRVAVSPRTSEAPKPACGGGGDGSSKESSAPESGSASERATKAPPSDPNPKRELLCVEFTREGVDDNCEHVNTKAAALIGRFEDETESVIVGGRQEEATSGAGSPFSESGNHPVSSGEVGWISSSPGGGAERLDLSFNETLTATQIPDFGEGVRTEGTVPVGDKTTKSGSESDLGGSKEEGEAQRVEFSDHDERKEEQERGTGTGELLHAVGSQVGQEQEEAEEEEEEENRGYYLRGGGGGGILQDLGLVTLFVCVSAFRRDRRTEPHHPNPSKLERRPTMKIQYAASRMLGALTQLAVTLRRLAFEAAAAGEELHVQVTMEAARSALVAESSGSRSARRAPVYLRFEVVVLPGAALPRSLVGLAEDEAARDLGLELQVEGMEFGSLERKSEDGSGYEGNGGVNGDSSRLHHMLMAAPFAHDRPAAASVRSGSSSRFVHLGPLSVLLWSVFRQVLLPYTIMCLISLSHVVAAGLLIASSAFRILSGRLAAVREGLSPPSDQAPTKYTLKEKTLMLGAAASLGALFATSSMMEEACLEMRDVAAAAARALERKAHRAESPSFSTATSSSSPASSFSSFRSSPSRAASLGGPRVAEADAEAETQVASDLPRPSTFGARIVSPRPRREGLREGKGPGCRSREGGCSRGRETGGSERVSRTAGVPPPPPGQRVPACAAAIPALLVVALNIAAAAPASPLVCVVLFICGSRAVKQILSSSVSSSRGALGSSCRAQAGGPSHDHNLSRRELSIRAMVDSDFDSVEAL